MSERVIHFPNLIEAIRTSPTIELVGKDSKPYQFRVFPFGEGGAEMEFEVLDEIIRGLAEMARPFRDTFDYVAAIAPIGLHWGSAVADELKLHLKCSWVRKNNPLGQVTFGDELAIQIGGPHGRELVFRDIKSEDRVALVDDVISTGETIKPVVSALRTKGARVSEVFVIVTKGKSYQQLEKSLDIRVLSLVNLTEKGEITTI